MKELNKSLPRVEERPRPESWRDDELMTLEEAAAVFWPQGPLTVAALRTAIHRKQLKVTVIGRRHLVTPAAVRDMSRPTGLPNWKKRSQGPVK